MEGRKREVIVLLSLLRTSLRGVHSIQKIGKPEHRKEAGGWSITSVTHFFIHEHL